LGATFLYAGLQKLANPNFFNANSPISIQSQLIAADRTSPLHFLLGHIESFAKPLGLVIAFAEVAIGVGALLGLWMRIAALGGLILSFSLFLTVSFHASPYFTGADIVFFFAWMPFIIGGGGSALSLDGLIASRVADVEHQPSPTLVPIPFASVQTMCGNYHEGTCSARAGLACDASACPVLLGPRAPIATRVAIDSIDRRSIVMGTVAAVGVGASVLVLGGIDAAAGRIIGHAPKPKSGESSLSIGTTTTTPGTTSTTSTGPAPKGTLLGAAKDVPENHAAPFTVPSNGDPGIVVHTEAGTFVGYDAVCPHAGCTVGFSRSNQIFVCPCHGSEFDLLTGDVLVGPAPHGLTKYTIVKNANGNLYLE
jgi:thiosulfate dehydrogenase [quinone] large subunit